MARRAKNQNGRQNGGMTNARHSDRALLANIADAIEADGWASTTGIAVECGFRPGNDKHQTPAVKVASRLAYMRDIGLLESTGPDLSRPYENPGDRDKRWRLSDMGEAILNGSLSRAVEKAIEKMEPGAQILMMRQLAQRGYLSGDETVAFTMRREWQHNASQRRLVLHRGSNR